MSASAVILETASPGTARPEPTASELAELEAAILVLRRELERPQSGRLAAPDGSRLSLTAHFLNLAPSTTARLRLWMILGTEAGVELLGDPLAHLRPVDTLETGVAPRLLDRVAERLKIASRLC